MYESLISLLIYKEYEDLMTQIFVSRGGLCVDIHKKTYASNCKPSGFRFKLWIHNIVQGMDGILQTIDLRL